MSDRENKFTGAKQMDDLKEALKDFPLQQQIFALEINKKDGEFLSGFSVTQEEVEELYAELLEKYSA